MDGTYDAWTNIPGGFGHAVTVSMANPGIYEVKAVIGGVDQVFVRRKDGEHSPKNPKKAGTPDCFGVVDTDWQLALIAHSRSNLGSTAYAYALENYPLGEATPKCNLFVARVAAEAGVVVPWINKGTYGIKTYPPVANQWAGTLPGNIVGWAIAPASFYPQPGWIVANSDPGMGHVGVIDYDGAWISAGPKNINRNADLRSPNYHPAIGRFRN